MMTTTLTALRNINPPRFGDPGRLSAASPDVALMRPVVELVEATLKASGRSDHTKRAYRTAIGLFLQFLDAERGGLLPGDLAGEWRPFAHDSREGRRTIWRFEPPTAILRLVDASLLDTFRAWRERQGDSPNAASARVAAVRTFLAVAYRDGVLTTEQAQALGVKAYRQRQRRDEQPVGRRLSLTEVQALREAVNANTNKGKRDLVILDLMLFAGLRRDEVASLRLENVWRDGGRWWLVLTGKGKKTRRVKVHDNLYRSLSGWLQVAGLELEGTGCIFFSVNKGDRIAGNCINASVVGRLVAEYGHRAGLAPLTGKNQLSAHDLRRTCARNAFDNGASLLLVQAMLGHIDPKTTAHYIGAFVRDDDTAIDHVRC